MAHRLAALVLVTSAVCGVAGCTDSEPTTKPTRTATITPYPAPSLGPLGRPGCAPASPFKSMELQGTPAERGTTLYGLAFVPAGEAFKAGDDVKIVWRMTGKGDLVVRLIDPDGRTKALEWGPEAHGGSTYHRPGDEWGTGLAFDRAGCWEIRFARDRSHASVWVDVAA